MKYDKHFIKELNSKINLYDYVSDKYELIKKGSVYYAHCPLHIDNTPSLAVYKNNNSFHCFSCGISGGFIQWLYYIEKLKYDNAVARAMVVSGINHEADIFFESKRCFKMCRSYKQDVNDERTYLDESIYNKYHSCVPEEWLKEGISKSTMEVFEIKIDETSNRIVYPVRDIQGRLINIKGRTRFANYKDLKIPKYINYYKTNGVDYFQGMNITYTYIKTMREVIVFESLKSVMKCFDWGVKNTVSAEKHTLTKAQISVLIRLKVDIVLAYDSDINYYRDAAVIKNINILKRFANVYVLYNPSLLGGADSKNSPADCGEEVFKEMYRHRIKIM